MKIYHWFSDDFKKPESMLGANNFLINIADEKVEIECSWDYGYNGAGTERVFIPFETILKFFEEHKQEIVRRSNGVANNVITQPIKGE